MTDKSVSRQKQAIETYERILAASQNLLLKKDYESITISEIAKEANISVGGFYHYFSSKEELFYARYYEFDINLKKYIENKHYESNIEAIFDLINYQCSMANIAGPKFRAQDIRMQLSTNSNYLLNSERFLHQYLKQLVDNAIHSGEFKDESNTDEIVSTIMRIVRGDLFNWALRRGNEPAEENAMHDLDIIINYYKK